MRVNSGQHGQARPGDAEVGPAQHELELRGRGHAVSLLHRLECIKKPKALAHPAYGARHGYRALPEHRHRLSRSRLPGRLLRRDVGLEGRGLPRLGRDPRRLRPVHRLPAGGGLHRARMAGPGRAPADAPRRAGRRPRCRGGCGARARCDQGRAPAGHHLAGVPRSSGAPVLSLRGLTRAGHPGARTSLRPKVVRRPRRTADRIVTMREDEIWDVDAAQRYDTPGTGMFAPDVLAPTVDRLVDLAGGGRALELAIGTGRVAVPLAERGVAVSGIELSAPMVDRLRTKADAQTIPVVPGDMAAVRAPGEFALVYLVFNTISNLLTQAEQVECFRNAARHLAPGGCFVVELWVPELRKLPPGQPAVVWAHEPGYVGLDTYDVLNQHVVSHHFRFGAG